MVVMDGRNIDDIIPMVELTRQLPISVRFIEEMPFNGTEGLGNVDFWPAKKILTHIIGHYGDVLKLPDPDYSTSVNYQVAGYQGSFGIIAAFTRSFCGSCNRIRVTPQGILKTCLYDGGKLDIRDLLRKGVSDDLLKAALLRAFQQREKDGFEAEANRNPVSESMATIGG
jgi:cyclic pyranopterin phosphate synthase